MSAQKRSSAWPQELTFEREARRLKIRFDNGESYDLPFELLRIESPSAEERGHGPEPRTIAGKRKVGVTSADPVGRYAVRIGFDDGHNSGLFTWDYLRDLGKERDGKMRAYLERLAKAGLSRD